MKFESYCSEGWVIDTDCKKRSFGCEFGCDIGEGLADTVIVVEEEKILGKGGREILVGLVSNGWEPIGGNQYVGYLVRGEGKSKEFLVPDYVGGFYSRK